MEYACILCMEVCRLMKYFVYLSCTYCKDSLKLMKRRIVVGLLLMSFISFGSH